eukprot:9090886-Prorocentrum_lima.AAC.1
MEGHQDREHPWMLVNQLEGFLFRLNNHDMLWKVVLWKHKPVGGRPTEGLNSKLQKRGNRFCCWSNNKSRVLMPQRDS